MKHRVTALLAGAALVVIVSVPAAAGRTGSDQPANPFLSKVEQRSFSVSGTVASAKGKDFVVRIDDHGHLIPFTLGRGVSVKPKTGQRVSVRYHPDGDTGQVADDVNVR